MEEGRLVGINQGDRMENMVSEISSKLSRRVVVSLDEINWSEAGEKLKFSILLRLASRKPIQKQKMEEVLRGVWKVTHHMEFLKVESNIMLVRFTSQEDQNKVIEGGPWNFEGCAIQMQRWEKGMMGEDFENTKINIWVRLYRLPYELRTEKFAEKIAMYAGEVKERKGEGDDKGLNLGGEFVRIRIELDTTKPILPGLFLKRDSRKPVWIPMKYEKMPMICFKCGRMTRDTRACREVTQGEENGVYESWIREEERQLFCPAWSEDGERDGLMVVSPPSSPGRRTVEEMEAEESGQRHINCNIDYDSLEVVQSREGWMEKRGEVANFGRKEGED